MAPPPPLLSVEKRIVLLLAAAQALFQTASVMTMTLAALVGQHLASDKTLATLPIAMMAVSAAGLMIPAALLMRRHGRRTGFALGALLGGLSGVLAAAAIWRHDFWLFVLATMAMGGYQAFAQYYRFAAADVASLEFRSRAIAWVVAGGVVAAVAGPNLVRLTQGVGPLPFVAAYLTLAGLGMAALLVIARLTVPAMTAPAEHGPGRRLAVILRQPVFLTALAGSAVGYAVMVMVMTATPLAMQMCGQTVGDAATVIQWHVLGMFVPSFFTGGLIRRHGVLTIMAIGVALLVGHVAIALSGLSFLHFLSGLILLGVGWNFLFIGGTTLLTEACQPGDRAKTQAAHDFLVFGAVSLGSFAAGGLLNAWGWLAVNLTALPVLLLALGAVLALGLARRRAAVAAAGG